MSGIATGVAAVLLMVAIGNGARARVLAQIEALGRNMLVVNAADAPRPGSRPRSAPRVTTLRPGDVAPLVWASPSVALAAPAQDGGRRVKVGITSMQATIRATTPEWAVIRNFPLAAGRFITREDDAALARVAVIGARVRETLFPGTDPVGRTILVGRVPFQVVGVLGAKGLALNGGSGEDEQVVIPLQTGLRRVFNVDYLRMIYVQVAGADLMDDAVREMRHALRARHRPAGRGWNDDFTSQDQAIALRAERESIAAFRRTILALGAVALVLGGTGILAVMMLSVSERTGEIGLRIALGARRRDIVTQFLAEAGFLALAGGAIGVAAGVLVAGLVGATTRWATVTSGGSVAIALGTAILTGVVSGVVPAGRAARLDPIAALRAE